MCCLGKFSWAQCGDGLVAVDFSLTTGSYASEINWALQDVDGNTLYSGGAPHSDTWCIDEEGIYTFLGWDSYGDGWNGALATFNFNDLTLSYTVEGAEGQFDLLLNGVFGCTVPIACNYDPIAIAHDGSCDFASCQGCTDENACNYNLEASIYDGSCLYFDSLGNCSCSWIDVLGVCEGSCDEDQDNNGICDNEEVYGCSYPLAQNYNALVTRDDGSCIFPCEGSVNSNTFDWDGDYSVTIADFLAMLSVFGDVDVDADGVWDSSDLCIDANACNYANDPSEECAFIDVLGICGGGCDADEDNDGICDEQDSCIGIEDQCGICNGPGPTEVVIEDIVITYDSVFLPLDDDWYVFPISADTTFSYECLPLFACGDPLSYQGYDYATVLIGEQCWFAENLRSELYLNGDSIPSNLSDNEWDNAWYGATAVHMESASNLAIYGRLYNWWAVHDVRGMCPSGWHVPSDVEWMTMEITLGMSEEEANNVGWRGTDEGSQMKTNYAWSAGGDGTNSSGFSGLPGGYRDPDGNFLGLGSFAGWWSSSPGANTQAWFRYLNGSIESVNRGDFTPVFGFSVRCIQDAE